MHIYTLDYLISSCLATYYYQAYYKWNFVLAFRVFSALLEFVDVEKETACFNCHWRLHTAKKTEMYRHQDMHWAKATEIIFKKFQRLNLVTTYVYDYVWMYTHLCMYMWYR